MTLQREFDGKIYDSFYGKSFTQEGKEHYVSLDLESGGGGGFPVSPASYVFLVRDMVRDLKAGREILLHTSPGIDERKGVCVLHYFPFEPEVRKMLRDFANGVLDGSLADPVSLV